MAAKKQRDVSVVPNKGGRPQLLKPDEATLDKLRGLGQLHATTRECASLLHVHENTYLAFKSRYPEAQEAYDEGKGHGMLSLRRSQIRLSEHNATMAIFLGKNNLGQTDASKLELSGEVKMIEERIVDPHG